MTYGQLMIEIGRRARSQPAPPHIVFESLSTPNRDPNRLWLTLLEDEQAPTVLSAEPPVMLVWSSLWPSRPDAHIRFDLPSDGGQGTQLMWTLLVCEPLPDASKIGHFRKRINTLINADLRYSFGQ